MKTAVREAMVVNRLVVMALLCCGVSGTAHAQVNWTIELYADAQMLECSLNYTEMKIVQVHIFHTGDTPATAVEFALYPPACLNGAIWAGDFALRSQSFPPRPGFAAR